MHATGGAVINTRTTERSVYALHETIIVRNRNEVASGGIAMANGQTSVAAISAQIAQEGLPWEAGENDYTRLSDAQQLRRLGLLITPEENQRLTTEARQFAAKEQTLLGAMVGAPAAFDWRNNGGNWVTSVKDQGDCGSCVSFCTCSTMESAVRIKLGNPNYAIDLSEAFCQFCGGGSCGGWGLTSGLSFAQSTGVTDEACMPYSPTDMNCNASRCSNWASRLTKIKSFTGYSTMDARKNALATIGPLLAGMAVYTDFGSYNNGIYVKTANATLRGHHCISVVGYDDNNQCWHLKNSWGTSFGSGGFIRVRYNQPDLLLDTSWAFYSVVPDIQAGWLSNVTVSQVYASRDSQNAWAHIAGYGWRRIQTGSPDGITNMLTLLSMAVAEGKKVTVYADGDFVYQGYLL
jgi:C1A family cysteine protease